MNAAELSAWVEDRKKVGACVLQALRAGKGGARSGQVVTTCKLDEAFDAGTLLRSLAQDADERKRPVAMFLLVASKEDGKEVGSTRVRLVADSLDEEESPSTGESVEARMLRIVVAQNTALVQHALTQSREAQEGARAVCGEAVGLAKTMAEWQRASEERHNQTVAAMIDFAQLKHEQQVEANAHAERREMIRSGMSELGPLAAAIVGKLLKLDTGTRLGLFLKSLKPAQIDQLLESKILSDEQLGSLVSLLQDAPPEVSPGSVNGVSS